LVAPEQMKKAVIVLWLESKIASVLTDFALDVVEESVQPNPCPVCLLIHVHFWHSENPLQPLTLEIRWLVSEILLDLNDFFHDVKIAGDLVVVGVDDAL